MNQLRKLLTIRINNGSFHAARDFHIFNPLNPPYQGDL